VCLYTVSNILVDIYTNYESFVMNVFYAYFIIYTCIQNSVYAVILHILSIGNVFVVSVCNCAKNNIAFEWDRIG